VRASCKTSYWAEVRDAAANCAYKDHDGSRNVTIKRDDGNQVPRTCRTRRTDAWGASALHPRPTSLDFAASSTTFWAKPAFDIDQQRPDTA